MSSYPVIEFDYLTMPNIADNIWYAQMAGWERVLTYRGPLPDAMGRQIRDQTMRYKVGTQQYEIPAISRASTKGKTDIDRDEYPFACTEEGSARIDGRQVCMAYVPALENQIQGGMLRKFILQHGLKAAGPNNKFEVRVVNHPRDLHRR